VTAQSVNHTLFFIMFKTVPKSDSTAMAHISNSGFIFSLYQTFVENPFDR